MFNAEYIITVGGSKDEPIVTEVSGYKSILALKEKTNEVIMRSCLYSNVPAGSELMVTLTITNYYRDYVDSDEIALTYDGTACTESTSPQLEMTQCRSDRGFSVITFNDYNGTLCDLKKSSLADEEAIWFGLRKAEPLIMASKVTSGGRGWAKYTMPEGVHIGTHMHLAREQIKALLPILERFVDTGDVSIGTSVFDPTIFPDEIIPGFAEACKNTIQFWEDFNNVGAVYDECVTDNPRVFAEAVYPIFFDEMGAYPGNKAIVELIATGISDAPEYAPADENN